MNDLFLEHYQKLLEDSNQKEAFESDRNTVVVAGPGSGKTRILSMKAIKLAQREIRKPFGLACISYSRETVRELKERILGYGYNFQRPDFIGTIHAFCLTEIVIPFSSVFPDYGIPSPLRIATYEIMNQVYKEVLDEQGLTSRQLTYDSLNKFRTLNISGKSQVQIDNLDEYSYSAILFDEKLSKYGFIDFIQITTLAAKMVSEKAMVRVSLESKFPWLLIDEYQDLGRPLHEMVLELQATTEMKIFAVGDRNQSIYGFSGAYPEFLHEIENLDDFNTIHLTWNYRSNPDIIDASKEALGTEHTTSEYQSKIRSLEKANFRFIECDREMSEQYEVVAKVIIPQLRNEGIPYDDIGILTGSNKEIVQLSMVLHENEIPFYVARWQFEKSDTVIWLQKLADWCIGSETVNFSEQFQFYKYLLNVHSNQKRFLDDNILKIRFHEVIEQSKEHWKDLQIWFDFILSELDLMNLLNTSERYPEEVNNLSILKNEIDSGNLKSVTITRFARLEQSLNEITITTRHSSKGLEFEVVLMLGMEEERFPFYSYEDGSKEMMEAQRLCYVCVSRAKKSCVLLYSKQHTLPSRRGPWKKNFKPSRFWLSIYKKFGDSSNTFSGSKLISDFKENE